ncbi:hypothetical protein HCQ94_03755 [Actinomyces sp. zg-332]|uniref:ATP-grasp domain-containing protein n=1 Tax=Actinomyces sp. zg-332 TaxID=2708340 RepID=UPI00141FD343|nr:hypothetical protein [Actinomyces sp. zg-332]QPK93719.1 hypothetical protein HCQ94_03755 [Actinomyces sp. zg-332]
MKILVLVLQSDFYEPVNNFFIPQSLTELNHSVFLGDVNSLQILNGQVITRIAKFKNSKVGEKHVFMEEYHSCEDFDLCWLLDYSHPNKIDDFFRILWVLEGRIKFVNLPSSIFFLNNKIGMQRLSESKFYNNSVLLDSDKIVSIVDKSPPEEKWVIKAPNKGCGADVFVLHSEDKNKKAIIESAVGNPKQLYEMYGKTIHGFAEQYAVLQKYIPNLDKTESRVLLAGGKILGGYRKIPAKGDFRGNYLIGGKCTPLELNNDTQNLSLKIAKELMKFGINFAGIDIAYPHLIELNLVNPGGISGHLEATGEDIGKEVCKAVLEKV